MKIKKFLFILVLGLLSGCSSPLPEDKSAYSGKWQSSEMELLILPDGTVAYERLKDGGSISLNFPLKEFQGDNFVVGFGPISTTFEVSKAPYCENGICQMVVDGVRLTKVPE